MKENIVFSRMIFYRNLIEFLHYSAIRTIKAEQINNNNYYELTRIIFSVKVKHFVTIDALAYKTNDVSVKIEYFILNSARAFWHIVFEQAILRESTSAATKFQ